MPRIISFIFILLAALAIASADDGPIHYAHEARENPALHLHVATVDLSSPLVKVRVVRSGEDPDGPGPFTTTLHTVREVAQREGFDLAVNGDFFAPGAQKVVMGQLIKYPLGAPARVMGTAMSDGVTWQLGPHRLPALVVTDQGQVLIDIYDKLPPGARQVVSGSVILLRDGKPLAEKEAKRSPHTAAGIDRSGKKLTLLVVDGRRDDYSVGMTDKELALEMAKRGCWAALNLDGGGSSTMVMRDQQSDEWKLLNRPSDGYQAMIPLSIERPVASVLGVRITKSATQP